MLDDLNTEVWRLLRYPKRGELLLDGRPPTLTEPDVSEIIRTARDAEFASIGTNDCAYGESFMTLAIEAATFNDLMVRMAMAGRLEICETGVLLAMRAAHRVVIGFADLDGTLSDWATLFREWAEVAEDLAADLEQRYAEELTAEMPDATVGRETGPIRSRHAEAARARAARSWRRGDQARSDNAAVYAEQGWSPAKIAKQFEPHS